MLRRIPSLALSATLALMAAATAQAAAAGALQFAPCAGAGEFSCATLDVPLRRSGTPAGTLSLSVELLQSSAAPTRTAVLLLAGGPGQAAIPLAQTTAKSIAPALHTRDLLVFDQRGTGASSPLACAALEGGEAFRAIGGAFERCALQIGPQRGSYTTQESIADIDALRQAGGYEKLVLLGVSYGTKVALEYAERYPQDVEALVLDSVVPTDRADPFSLFTFKAMRPVFEELCSAGACRKITSNPLADLARLVRRLHRHALSGSAYDGSGRRHSLFMSDVDLFELILAGDLNPALRALLPASVQSALHGDPDPLLRLNLLSDGLTPSPPGITAASSDVEDQALFADTTCEEAAFPWQRSSPPQTRRAEALAALHALPESDFYPFTASIEWERRETLSGCLQWPNLAPAPPAISSLPPVPTLILSGAQDLRTPTSGAEAVAARIPGAELVVVPYTGHSVLGGDFSDCAQAAVESFFTSGTAQQCPATHDPFAPTPITPTKLASVKAIGGLPGRVGSTLAVALDTIVDLERQVIGATFQADEELPNGSSFGGLRGGSARLSSRALHLNRLSFVKGVQITGTFPLKGGRSSAAELRVEGSQAARGTIRVGPGRHVSGTLGGRHFKLNLTKVKLASRSGQSPSDSAPGLGFRDPALAHVR